MLNFISYEMAYCLYPIPTLIHRHGLSFQCAASRYQPAIQKYQRCGWPIHNFPHLFPATNCHIGLDRSVDDAITWRFPLDMEGVKQNPALSSVSLPLSQDPVTVAAFHLGPDPKLPLYFYITKCIFKHPLLHYQYCHIFPLDRWVDIRRFLAAKWSDIGSALESLSGPQRQDSWFW